MVERSRVAVLISGRGSNMAALIFAAQAEQCPYEVVLVTGDKAEARGFDIAEAQGIRTVRLNAAGRKEAFFDELDEALLKAEVDLIALAGFMRIIPDGFLNRWASKILNIHPSLLPKYKGLHTHAACLAAGDKSTGATVHLVTRELDSGEILGQVQVAVLPGDTAETLDERVLIAEHQLYPRILADYAARPFDPSWVEAQVDALASKLPGVARKTSHGSPGWAVGGDKGKLFAILVNHRHGEDAIGILVKSSGSDEMNGLIEAQPDIYYWPKYYGASGWLGIRLSRRDLDWSEVSDWLVRSWELAAPRRMLEAGGR